MLRIAWRQQRTGLIGMTAFGLFYGLFQAGAYSTAAGTTVASRAAFGHQMVAFGASFSYILPLPVHVETVAGYMQWRVYGALPMVFVFWCLMSATGGRGDEEKGLVEGWLGGGISRARYLALRVLAFAAVAVVAVAATSAAIDAGAAKAGAALPIGALAEQSAALLGVTLACYGLALAVAQLTPTRNSAAGLAGVVLLALLLINGFSRTATGLRPLAAAVSPFYYYDRSAPLREGGSFDPVATGGLFIAGSILAVLAALMMRGRDLGSPFLQLKPSSGPRVSRPASNPLLRLPVLAGLYEQRANILAWSLGCLLAAAFIASIGKQMVTLVNGGGAFGAYLTAAGHGDPYVAITGFFWFGIFQMLLAVFAITQVARWSADDNEGRLEMILSAPVSRARVVTERALTLLVATSVVVLFSSVGFFGAARAAGIHVGPGDLAAASWPLLPFALSFAAVGAVLASWVPRATVATLATIAFLSYLLTDFAPVLKWPDWTDRLSPFSLYGHPIANGVYWNGVWILVAITVAGFALAMGLMQRRQVGA